MTPKQHIIELNGKRYDTVTGKIIPPNPAKTAIDTIKNASVDGFSKAIKPLQRPNNSVPAHQTEKSKTLMRKTVHKPNNRSKHTPENTMPLSRIQKSASTMSAITLAQAKAVQKSSLIKRFNDMTPSNSVQNTKSTQTNRSNRVQSVATSSTVSKNPIEVGLANAVSHEQPKTKKTRTHVKIAKKLRISPKFLSAGSLLLAGLIVGGFFAFQNVSNLSMRVASSRAGVHGSIPSYQPSGFGLKGGVSYSPGQIILGYKSNSDDRSYNITQNASAWNSDTLAENYDKLKDNSSFQTIPVKGKTVYIYDGSNATWVDGGIWYRIEGNSKLNSDQLLKIANSM